MGVYREQGKLSQGRGFSGSDMDYKGGRGHTPGLLKLCVISVHDSSFHVG